MHFRQPGFTFKVCGPFTKKKKRIKKIKDRGEWEINGKYGEKFHIPSNMKFRSVDASFEHLFSSNSMPWIWRN